jgi:hypothetical protein
MTNELWAMCMSWLLLTVIHHMKIAIQAEQLLSSITQFERCPLAMA